MTFWQVFWPALKVGNYAEWIAVCLKARAHGWTEDQLSGVLFLSWLTNMSVILGVIMGITGLGAALDAVLK